MNLLPNRATAPPRTDTYDFTQWLRTLVEFLASLSLSLSLFIKVDIQAGLRASLSFNNYSIGELYFNGSVSFSMETYPESTLLHHNSPEFAFYQIPRSSFQVYLLQYNNLCPPPVFFPFLFVVACSPGSRDNRPLCFPLRCRTDAD